jgi:ACS family pantothenate transporter-like MFS transporter
MSLTAIGYFIKYLDQININNAFVSGMYVSQPISHVRY